MLDFRQRLINSTLLKVLKRLHYPFDVMLTSVRWYVACTLSPRHIEEMMQDRGVFVYHVIVHSWAIKMLSGLLRLQVDMELQLQGRRPLKLKQPQSFTLQTIRSQSTEGRHFA
jgi:hypothetical protein